MIVSSSNTISEDPRSEFFAAGDLLSAKIDRFITMIRNKDHALIDELMGSDGGFHLVGSEAGEICDTREKIEAKLDAIFANPGTLILDFPNRRIRIVGNAAWIFASGELRRMDSDNRMSARQYLAICVFENVAGEWRWREFFGSEPS